MTSRVSFPAVNLRDDRETAANPDLVPEQSWELDLEGVHNLGTRGTTTPRIYGRLIEDLIDTIPIGERGSGRDDRASRPDHRTDLLVLRAGEVLTSGGGHFARGR